MDIILLLLSLGLLIAGMVKADAERKALPLASANGARNPIDAASLPLPNLSYAPASAPSTVTPPVTPAPPATVCQPVEVAVVTADPLDNAPLLRLLEEMSRFGGDLGADAEHFSVQDRELSDFVLERLLEMMERVPGVTRIAPAPGEAVVRGEHKTIDGTTSAGTIKRLVMPGVRVSERVLRPAIVEIES